MGCKSKNAEEEIEAVAKRLDGGREKEAGEIFEKIEKLSKKQEGDEKWTAVKIGKPMHYSLSGGYTTQEMSFEQAVLPRRTPREAPGNNRQFQVAYASLRCVL